MARVLLFGSLCDVAGWRERQIEASSLGELKALLSREDPALGEALSGKGVQVAVEQVVIRAPDLALEAHAEVAFLPPMSGG